MEHRNLSHRHSMLNQSRNPPDYFVIALTIQLNSTKLRPNCARFIYFSEIYH